MFVSEWRKLNAFSWWHVVVAAYPLPLLTTALLVGSIIHSLWHPVKQFHLQLPHCSTAACLTACLPAWLHACLCRLPLKMQARWQSRGVAPPFLLASLPPWSIIYIVVGIEKWMGIENAKGFPSSPPPSSSWSSIYTCHLPVEFLIFSPFVHLFSDWLHHNYPTVLGSLGQSRPKCFLTSSNCCHMHPTPLYCSY